MRSYGRARSSVWLNLFFVYVGLLTFVGGVSVAREKQPWIIGDWLINYQGGFVRRGLTGEIAWLLGRISHVSPVVFAAIFFISLYAVFLLAFRDIALSTTLNPWIIALVVSPATLSFQLLHRNTGYRKEIIFLAGLAMFVSLLKRRRPSSIQAILYMTALLVFCTLSHEAVIFYAPYLFAALVMSGWTPTEAAKACAVPFMAGTVVFMICSSHIGNAQTVTQICSSLGYKFAPAPGALQICADGAIPFLVKSREVARAEADWIIVHFQYLTIFPCFALLALLPAVGQSVVLRRVGFGREVLVLWLTAGVSFAGTLLLFRYSIDWGRWIYIHVVSITLLLMFVDSKRRKSLETARGPEWRMAYGVLVFLYATLWMLPADSDALRFGYAQRALEKMHVIPIPANDDRTPVK